MAQPKIKVSQLSVATTIGATDSFMLIQGGVNKKTTVPTFLKNLNSNDHIRVNPIQFSVNFSVASKNDASALFVNGTTDKIGVGTNAPASKFHVNGNIQIGSASSDGVLVQSTEAITYNSTDQTNSTEKAISPSRSGSSLTCTTGVSGLFTLPAGSNGQIKTIVVSAMDVGKTITIATIGAGFNRITFGPSLAVGNSISLQYFASIAKWVVVGNYGATLATV